MGIQHSAAGEQRLASLLSLCCDLWSSYNQSYVPLNSQALSRLSHAMVDGRIRFCIAQLDVQRTLQKCRVAVSLCTEKSAAVEGYVMFQFLSLFAGTSQNRIFPVVVLV